MLLRNLEAILAGNIAHRMLASMWTERTVTEPAPEPVGEMPELPAAFVREFVALQDRVPEESRFSEYDDFIHVSSLVDMCPRKYALARQNNVTVRSSPSGAMRMVWEMGLAVEAHVIQQMQRAFGYSRITRGLELEDREYMISGRPDAMVEVAPTWDAVVEIKSMNAAQFQELEQPLANHVLQVLLYHWLLSRNPETFTRQYSPDRHLHDEVIILYAAKDYIRGGIYKEYHVNVNDESCQAMLSVALGLARELKDAMDRNGLPARRLCPDQNCTKARGCPVATLCFNIQGEAS